MNTVGNYISINRPFDESINDVHESEIAPPKLPKRTRLSPISSGNPETKLSQLFNPITNREQHIVSLLSPPSVSSDNVTPEMFRVLVDRAMKSLEKRKDKGGKIVSDSLLVLERLKSDRIHCELELRKMLNA